MLKIWGRKNSSNVRKALWCAEEAGVAYERVEAGGAFGVVDQPGYLARNPNGRVPMLEDGDLVLWESNAIVRYLAAAYGQGSLYLEDPASRACGDKWMDWTTSSFAGEFRDLFWGTLRTPVEQRNTALIEAARQRCSAAAICWQCPSGRWASSPTCLATASPWVTSRWAASSTPGSRCPSSARRSPTCRPGTRACASARPIDVR